MSDDVLTLVKAAQKERTQLTAKLKILRKREVEIRTQRTEAERRLAQIDEAFAPLKQTLAAAHVEVPKATPNPLRSEGRSSLDEIVAAIGTFGLREYTPRDILKVTNLSMQNIYGLLSQLHAAGRIRRLQPGVYRTAQAKIA